MELAGRSAGSISRFLHRNLSQGGEAARFGDVQVDVAGPKS